MNLKDKLAKCFFALAIGFFIAGLEGSASNFFVLTSANGPGGAPVWSHGSVTKTQPGVSHSSVYDPMNKVRTSSGGLLAFLGTDQIDQSFFSPNFNFQGFGLTAQTYTAGLTGDLTGINLQFLNCSICSNVDIPISIHTVSGGVPTTTILGSTLLPVAAGQTIPFSLLITFSQSIPQVAGNEYAIVIDFGVTSTNVTGEFNNSYPAGAALSSFDGGSTWSGGNNGFDISFQTHVNINTVLEIDIKPGSFPNSINPDSNGVIPVAILTTGDFDASSVDPATVRFGANGTEAAPVNFGLVDVDGDGDLDMLLHFNTRDTGIKCGDAQAKLTGKTTGGDLIMGADSVNTVGCKSPQATVTDSQGLVAIAANVRRAIDPTTVYSPRATDGRSHSYDFGNSRSSLIGLD